MPSENCLRILTLACSVSLSCLVEGSNGSELLLESSVSTRTHSAESLELKSESDSTGFRDSDCHRACASSSNDGEKDVFMTVSSKRVVGGIEI